MKRVINIICLVMLVVILTGCDLFNKKGGINQSVESLYDGLCDMFTADKRIVKDYLAMYPEEIRSKMRDGKTDEELQKMLDSSENQYVGKTCRYELIKTYTKDEISASQNQYNKEYNAKQEFKSCKQVNLYMNDEKIDNSTACEVEDGNWYIFEF